MKIQGTLAKSKTDSILNEDFIPDLPIYNKEGIPDDEKIIVQIKHFTTETYHSAMSRGGMMRPNDIFARQVYGIKNCLVGDDEVVDTADKLLMMTKSPVANLMVQLVVQHLFESAQVSDEERKN